MQTGFQWLGAFFFLNDRHVPFRKSTANPLVKTHQNTWTAKHRSRGRSADMDTHTHIHVRTHTIYTHSLMLKHTRAQRNLGDSCGSLIRQVCTQADKLAQCFGGLVVQCVHWLPVYKSTETCNLKKTRRNLCYSEYQASTILSFLSCFLHLISHWLPLTMFIVGSRASSLPPFSLFSLPTFLPLFQPFLHFPSFPPKFHISSAQAKCLCGSWARDWDAIVYRRWRFVYFYNVLKVIWA